MKSNRFELESTTKTNVLCQIETVVIKHEVKLHPSWMRYLEPFITQPAMQELFSFLEDEKAQGKKIFPAAENYFAALELTPFEKVKVVIVGQDPYHGLGQAHGLSFSVPPGVRFPPSLRNILKELQSDLDVEMPQSGSLVPWAKEGVLLLNAVLSVEEGKAASHQKKGWEEFTDKIIHVLNEEKEHVVFILWGSYAQKKAAFVDRQRHLVIEGVHPSPLSAHRGFFGTKPFSSTNKYLVDQGLKPVNWNLLSES